MKTYRNNIRKFWLKLHLALALSVGLLFVILGLTGSCNVFYYELREWNLAKPMALSNQQPLPLDHLLQIVQTEHPQRQGSWSLLLPGYGADYLLAEYLNPEETRSEMFAPLEVLVDPYTGRIAEQSFWGRTLPSKLYEIHAALMLGTLGKEAGQLGFNTVSSLGALLFLSCLSGLYLWWPRTGKFKKASTIKAHASSERFYYDVHKTAGFYGSLCLLILAFTGFAFGYENVFRPIVALFSPVAKEHLQVPELKSTRLDAQPPMTVMQAVAVADRIFPGAELRMINTPDGPDGVYMVAKKQAGEANRKRPRSKVWIDQYSGKVLAVQDPNRFTAGETFFNLLWPLHDGQAFGQLGRIVWCMVGFLPFILYVSGVLWWLRKRKAQRMRTNTT
ncbi:PepSY domain-containing protein [Methylococcaceae bacterium WWC4]|nr:PepSY domain-containing protein [Methylococcaceae bacterium WWC4]